MKDDLIRYDGTNADAFEYTSPAAGRSSLAGVRLSAKSWRGIFVEITERELKRMNPALQSLYSEALPPPSRRRESPFFVRRPPAEKEDLYQELSNGYWIYVTFSAPETVIQTAALCKKCGYRDADLVLCGRKKGAPKPPAAPAPAPRPPKSVSRAPATRDAVLGAEAAIDAVCTALDAGRTWEPSADIKETARVAERLGRPDLLKVCAEKELSEESTAAGRLAALVTLHREFNRVKGWKPYFEDMLKELLS